MAGGVNEALAALAEELERAEGGGAPSPIDGRVAAGGSAGQQKNVRVVIRVRPPLEHELNGYLGVPYQSTAGVGADARSITLTPPPHKQREGVPQQAFAFDHVYGPDASQRDVFESTARPLVASCLEGYNATILAYGQTGTGKTYTMEGTAARFEDRGIVPRAIEQIFSHIQENATSSKRFLVRASYLQIYNDVIHDLLKPESANLQIREDDKAKHNGRGVYVEGLSEWVVRSPQEIFKLMDSGAAVRATGKTKLNDASSRSHAVLRLIVEQCETSFVDDNGRDISAEQFESLLQHKALAGDSIDGSQFVRQRFRVAKLNLVDLAGSERVRVSGATGQRLEESRKINRSLSALGNVISALTDARSRAHIPYRDSKLTRILEDSLGGNCKTAMLAMVSPALDAFSETLSTLKFANRAKNMRNTAVVNEDVDKNSLLRKYERELKRLRRELLQRSQSVVDQRVVLELEDQKRRAEADKMAALRALESRSFEFMREKQAKRKLEDKIAELEGKMLGGNLQDTPQFRQALNRHREQIRREYQLKMDDLEREREQIGAQRAQVDRYKQLLLKQRDIMVALTQRLNERDDQIVALQDELDETSRAQAEGQEHLDRKTAEVIHLQRINLELEDRLHHAVPDQAEPDALHAAERQQEIKHEGPADDATKGPAQAGLEARVRALTSQYRSFRDQMTERLSKKDAQLRQLLEANAALRVDRDGGEPAADKAMLEELERLRVRSVNHAKEQLAMRTIMEKIHLLVLNILSEPQGIDNEVLPQVRALSSLVSASVSALTGGSGSNPNVER